MPAGGAATHRTRTLVTHVEARLAMFSPSPVGILVRLLTLHLPSQNLMMRNIDSMIARLSVLVL